MRTAACEGPDGFHDHLRVEHFVATETMQGAAGTVARRALEHVVALCPHCRRQWEQLRNLQPVYLERLDAIEAPAPATAEPDPDDLDASPDTLAAHKAATAELRRLHRRAKEEMWILLRQPPERRAATIRTARRRFRSRQLAELLIEECRVRVRTDPAEARNIAELVPVVLRSAVQAGGPAWARPLIVLAAALRANALRIAGDLGAAERGFIDTRGELAVRPLADPRVLADVASLEASLRESQARLAETDQLLLLASLGFDLAGDSGGCARVQIKRAIVMRSAGDFQQCLAFIEEVLASLDPNIDSWLYFVP